MSERAKYGEEFESMFLNWNAEFDKLEVMMGNAGADPEDAYDDVISALRRRRHKMKTGSEVN